MEDTDLMQLPTTPFVRPVLEPFEEPTPTTSPGASRRPRLARGTMAPPPGTALPPPALPVRAVEPPKRWGYIVRVDLSPRLPAVTGEMGQADATMPVRRVGRTPWAIVAGAAAALAIGCAAVLLAAGDEAPRAASRAAAIAPVVAPAAPAIVVTPLPVDAPAAPAVAAGTTEPAEVPAPDPAPAVAAAPAPAVAPPVAAPAPAPGHGVLMIGSKPPCRILIDGKDTGLVTPQRNVRVPAGRRTITLVNDEFGISHSSTVVVTGGRKAKMIRDLSGAI